MKLIYAVYHALADTRQACFETQPCWIEAELATEGNETFLVLTMTSQVRWNLIGLARGNALDDRTLYSLVFEVYLFQDLNLTVVG
jgi:hypothetical protein